jgi:hypothetical protein
MKLFNVENVGITNRKSRAWRHDSGELANASKIVIPCSISS